MDRDRQPPLAFDRRTLLKAMAASLALAGAAGRRARADDRALPYVVPPRDVVPGKAKLYATAVRFTGYAQPVLGETRVGRPVKLEGNPEHPASAGATDAFTQAALLGLYDPLRSQGPRFRGSPTSWAAFDTAVEQRRRFLDGRQGDGFRLLTGSVTSPTMLRQIGEILERWPRAQWHVHEPLVDDAVVEASRRLFGRRLQPHLRLDQAEVVVCLDDDPLGPGPRQTLHAQRWSERRRAFQHGEGGSRLLVAEPTPSLTGARALDGRLAVAPSRIARLVVAMAAALGLEPHGRQPTADLRPHEQAWLDGAVDALRSAPGRSLLTIGPHHGVGLQEAMYAINQRLQAIGTTLRFTEPIASRPRQGDHSLAGLVTDMARGSVSTLFVLDSNPAYTAPGDLDVAAALANVDAVFHAGLHVDETAALSHWHAPLQHDLESWSDARSVDGTAGILQPLIRPFYSVRSDHALLDRWLGGSRSDHELVRATWRSRWRDDDFEHRWRAALVRGFDPDTAPTEVVPELLEERAPLSADAAADGLTLEVRPDPTLWDGRFAYNAWLQELPKPFTKVTWGNVILMGPHLARRHGIERGDEVELAARGGNVRGAAWPLPGQDEDTLTATLGGGRTAAGLEGEGYDAFRLMRLDTPPRIAGASLDRAEGRQVVACTQAVTAMEGYDFVRIVDAPGEGTPPQPPSATFFRLPASDSPSWGMTIDLDLCIGCNACVVACTAENNVPVVGKELVAEGRFMHWLRVDHYHAGDPADPELHFQPVPCMHCEAAPCEMGCPVNAAVHSSDGLNLQVYNRCIGTRTCSAYCPYKVRRFNWFDYTSADPESLQAMRNPEVTVRSRGVMEKCTYCVQRISAARIAAKLDGRPIRDGEVVTACQQVCPAQAITFGDVVQRDTAVSIRKRSPRDYTLVEEANTRPRTTYLARIGKGGDK
ncbi:MAG: 4Fe-4S dicluster domain-containing protein [Pseudomonadota bacterium]